MPAQIVSHLFRGRTTARRVKFGAGIREKML
jgi:hypothetical protein